mmetsp:Transcript_24109/g.41198  ORF Transcript_24109/g.41198 Transcript_24109/m.41198 type:complete len:289 (-) Transcript_24109:145-1011(-)
MALRDFYELHEELGQGEFSVVIRGTHKETGEEYAIKCIEKHDVDTSRLQTEVDILTQVSHPHIISLKEVFDTPDTLYLVMELITGGELFDKITEIGSYSEHTAAQLVANICSAVEYLHSLGIAHRDLKPTNLLLKDADDLIDVKIADFGLSKIMGENTMMQTACGTPIYVAPEVLSGEAYEKEVDMWSIGVITYILLCGFPPFFDDGSNMGELFEQIMAGEYDYPEEYWDEVSDEAKDFIDNLLLVDPAERFTASQALEHPWLQGSAPDHTLGVPSKMEEFSKTKFKK